MSVLSLVLCTVSFQTLGAQNYSQPLTLEKLEQAWEEGEEVLVIAVTSPEDGSDTVTCNVTQFSHQEMDGTATLLIGMQDIRNQSWQFRYNYPRAQAATLIASKEVSVPATLELLAKPHIPGIASNWEWHASSPESAGVFAMDFGYRWTLADKELLKAAYHEAGGKDTWEEFEQSADYQRIFGYSSLYSATFHTTQ